MKRSDNHTYFLRCISSRRAALAAHSDSDTTFRKRRGWRRGGPGGGRDGPAPCGYTPSSRQPCSPLPPSAARRARPRHRAHRSRFIFTFCTNHLPQPAPRCLAYLSASAKQPPGKCVNFVKPALQPAARLTLPREKEPPTAGAELLGRGGGPEVRANSTLPAAAPTPRR